MDIYKASYSGDIAAIEQLLAGAADVNVVNAVGYTPLHVAADASHASSRAAAVTSRSRCRCNRQS